MAGESSIVSKSCAPCKTYMNHLDGEMKCFLRKMNANFRHSVTIPERFMNHFGGKISEIIELESPNGSVYDVKVKKHMNKTVLQYGWEAFIDAHHVKENDSLLFQHVENCHFWVLILDADGCEKVFPCSGIDNSSRAQDKGVNSVDISHSSYDGTKKSPGVRKRFASFERGSPSHRSKTAKTFLTPSSSEELGQDTEGSSFSESSSEVDDHQPYAAPRYILTQRSMLSEEQEAKVTKLVEEISPQISLFVAVMKQSNVKLQSPSLVIPMPARNAETKFTVTVYLLREAKSNSLGGHGNDSKGVSSSEGRKGTKVTLTTDVKEEPVDGEHAPSRCNNYRRAYQKTLQSEDSGGPSSKPLFILSCQARLTRKQEKQVEERVRNIQSEVPIYVAVMNNSSVGNNKTCILIFIKRYATEYLPDGEQTMTLLRKGKRWKAKMLPRNGDQLMLTLGWRDFVQDNRLEVEDICLFQLMRDERKLTMKVHIIRNVEH
ncbi:hypothetical protein ACP4OV_007604 [Aristida adscensionis]